MGAAGLPSVFGGVAPAGGRRVVTLWIGTVRTFWRARVSISAETDMPGRNASLSRTRILTSNFGASCGCEELAAGWFCEDEFFEALATALTTPLNFRSLKASTSSRTV